MQQSISITAFNRPELLRQVIDSILENDTSGFTHCFCAIEPEKAEENLREILRLKDRFQIECDINPNNLGVRKNPYALLSRIFNKEKFDFNLYLEDDSILSPDAFDFVRFYMKEFLGRDRLMSCNLYNYHSEKEFPKEFEYSREFCALGFGITKEQWEKFFKPYWFDENIRIKNEVDIGGIGGWDWSIRAVMKEFDLYNITPSLSRAKHIGKVGIHCDESCWNTMFRDHPYSQFKKTDFTV